MAHVSSICLCSHLFVFSYAFSTSQLAEAMAADDMLVDSDPFGSGSPSCGL